MYMDPFRKAMHYIPSVFHATQNQGFRVPKDLKKLLQYLRGSSYGDVETFGDPPKADAGEDGERKELKNKLFINRMKSTVKKLQNPTHETCHSSKCAKVCCVVTISSIDILQYLYN